MRLYLAGPMRGIPQFNFPAFDAAAEKLRDLGHEVFNPADQDRAKYGDDLADGAHTGDEATVAESHGFDLRAALGADLHYITQCADAVAVLPGWEASKGARAEVATALALGLMVRPADTFVHATHDREAASSGYLAHNITDLSPLKVTQGDTVRLSGVISGEVRTASSTGGEKGVKPARFDLLPSYPLHLVAEHYGRGAAKYTAHNWRKGYEWSKSFAAMMRHAYAFWDGQDLDPETGTPHLAAVVFHAFTLMQGMRDWPDFDDRYKP